MAGLFDDDGVIGQFVAVRVVRLAEVLAQQRGGFFDEGFECGGFVAGPEGAQGTGGEVVPDALRDNGADAAIGEDVQFACGKVEVDEDAAAVGGIPQAEGGEMAFGTALRGGVGGQRAAFDDEAQFTTVATFAFLDGAGEGGYGAVVQPAAVGGKEAVFQVVEEVEHGVFQW